MTDRRTVRSGRATLTADDFFADAGENVLRGIEQQEREREQAASDIEHSRELRRNPALNEIDLLKEQNAERREYLEQYGTDFRQSLSGIRNVEALW